MSDNGFIIQLVMANQKACNPVGTAIVSGTFILKMHFADGIITITSSLTYYDIRNELMPLLHTQSLQVFEVL